MALTYRDRRVYDIMTALLITLSFAFLAREQYHRLLLLVPILCINRETAFLVPLVFIVWGWSRIERKAYMLMLSYMAVTFGTIQAGLRIIYAESPLWTEFFQLWNNIQRYIDAPLLTTIFSAVIALICWRVVQSWRNQHPFLQVTFLTTVPLLFVFYLVAGVSFETRVFAEVFSVIWVMILPTD